MAVDLTLDADTSQLGVADFDPTAWVVRLLREGLTYAPYAEAFRESLDYESRDDSPECRSYQLRLSTARTKDDMG